MSVARKTRVRRSTPAEFLDGAKILGRILARTLVLDNFEADLLTFVEAVHARTLNSRDVNENVRAALVRLDEAKTLGRIEPLNGTCSHNDLLGIARVERSPNCMYRGRLDRLWEGRSSQAPWRKTKII
jgi:hypothetical protein